MYHLLFTKKGEKVAWISVMGKKNPHQNKGNRALRQYHFVTSNLPFMNPMVFLLLVWGLSFDDCLSWENWKNISVVVPFCSSYKCWGVYIRLGSCSAYRRAVNFGTTKKKAVSIWNFIFNWPFWSSVWGVYKLHYTWSSVQHMQHATK